LALSRQGVSNEKVKKNAFHRVGLRNAPTMQDAANSKNDQQARKKEIERYNAKRMQSDPWHSVWALILSGDTS
jgi:hypothetical protein